MGASSEITAGEKKQRGQFFTQQTRIHDVMVGLLAHDSGRALEPSAGAGHLVAALERFPNLSIDAVELDERLTPVCETSVVYGDFFTYADGRDGQYDVIFGNPPYVAWKDVEETTRQSAGPVKERYAAKANLYYLFIDRCVDLLTDGGELVLIVPKEWLYTTSARPLRKKLAEQGALTDLIDCGEEKLFADADVPALLIFRWVKGAEQKEINFYPTFDAALTGTGTLMRLRDNDGRWALLDRDLAASIAGWGRVGDQFSVKVGMVTGLDAAFRLPAGHGVEPECVQQHVTTKRTVEEFLDVNHFESWESIPAGAQAHLTNFKEKLLARRIAAFTEENWWKYGAIRNAAHMAAGGPRIYVHAKTRSTQPFFTLPGTNYFGGGVLGLFPTTTNQVSIPTALKVFNSSTFREILAAMFLTTGDKVSFQPATLEDVPFPPDEASALIWLHHGETEVKAPAK